MKIINVYLLVKENLHAALILIIHVKLVLLKPANVLILLLKNLNVAIILMLNVVMIHLWNVLLLKNLYVMENQNPHLSLVLLVPIQDVHFVLNSPCLMEIP